MYLSRSQIINRDSVVWIERKRGEREWESRQGRTWGKRDGWGEALGRGFRERETVEE